MSYMQEWKTRRKVPLRLFGMMTYDILEVLGQTKKKWSSSFCCYIHSVYHFISSNLDTFIFLCIWWMFSGVYSPGEWSGSLECYLGNGFDSMIFQGLPGLCFPWTSEIICIQSICCIWKWKQACWTCSVLECFCDFLMILSHLVLNETVERHMIMFILNLHSFCSVCEVQVNWQPNPWRPVGDYWLCNTLIRK